MANAKGKEILEFFRQRKFIAIKPLSKKNTA
jgi:hypothetical protein